MMTKSLTIPKIPTSLKSPTASTKVILVRHGRSTYNEQGKHQGCSNASVLTEKGQKTAYQTGLALQGFNFDAIYTSPLIRVQQTTEAIVTAINDSSNSVPPVKSDSRLKEINMSFWQGLTYKYVKDNFPESYSCWKQTPHLFCFEREDSIHFPLQELNKKVKSFWEEILVKHCGQTILVVSHAGTNRALISNAIGLSPEKHHSIQQSNCGISLLEFPGDGSLLGELKLLNVTNHLGETLPKLKEGKTGWRWLLVSEQTTEQDWLKDYLDQEVIDLILSDNSHQSKTLVRKWQNNRRNTLHISVSDHNFLQTWQKTIRAKQNIKNSQSQSALTTGLIVVQHSILKDILAKTFNVKASVKTETNLSVIHYPHKNHQPILQGLLPTEFLMTISGNTDSVVYSP